MRLRNISSRSPFLWLIGLLLAISTSAAEIKTPGKIPLQPIPVKVQVERGKTVEIPLQVYGGGNESVNYRMCSTPQFGSLIGFRMIDANKGVVTYQHSGDFGHNGDLFYFAAKSIEGISARVAAEITVNDRPPKLIALMDVEFGEILIGTGAAALVSVTNEGGGIDRGVVTATSPWGVVGDPSYSLGPTESAVFTIVCNPVIDGELYGTVQFSSSPASSMMLHAKAIPPFRINRSQLELTLDRKSKIRSGTIQIENTAGFDQTIEVNGDDSLDLPEKFSLPADDHAEIRVFTKPDNLAALNTTILIAGANYSAHIDVTATTIPAIIEVDKTVLDFGGVYLRHSAERFFLISNRGGEKTFLDLAVAPPFFLRDDSVEFSLEPGEVRKIGVTIRPESLGRISGEIRVKGFQTEFPIRLVARTPRFAADDPPSDPEDSSGNKEWHVLDQSLPLLEGARLQSVTNTTATIEWSTDGNTVANYRLEARTLRLGKGTKNVEIRWIPFSNVRFDRSGGKTRATAADLTPGGGYNVRVVEVDALGQIVRASKTLQVIPFRERRFALTPIRVLIAILVVVSALLARQKVQKRRNACRQLVAAT